MNLVREKIVTDFAKWTALSATRSGSPIKSREDVYGVLDTVDFTCLFRADMEPIDDTIFGEWHKSAVDGTCKYQPRLNVIWAAKIINVYLKTRCYVGGYGRDGLIDVIHPPIDRGLISGLRDEGVRLSLGSTRVTRMKDITTYVQYEKVIQACRDFATLKDCSLVEVEQFWEGTNY